MITKHILPIVLVFLAFASDCDQSPEKPKPVADALVWLPIDKTQSEATDALQQFAPEVQSWLTDCEECRQVVVVPMGSNGQNPLNAPLHKFELPKPPPTFDEDAARAEAKQECKGRTNCEEQYIAEKRDPFEKQRAEQFALYQRHRSKVINEIMNAVLQRPTKEPPCTDIADMAAFIAQARASYVLWCTDGAHGCATPLKAQKFPGKVFLGLLPLVHEPNGDFFKRQETLRQLYPDVTIKPVATITVQELREFFRAF